MPTIKITNNKSIKSLRSKNSNSRCENGARKKNNRGMSYKYISKNQGKNPHEKDKSYGVNITNGHTFPL